MKTTKLSEQKHSQLYYYVRNIVLGLIDYEEDLVLTEKVTDSTLILELRVNKLDAGKVLGRNGENIAAVRRLLYAMARKMKIGIVVLSVMNRKEEMR